MLVRVRRRRVSTENIGIVGFNPRPARLAGRTPEGRAGLCLGSGFNPRPARLAGRTFIIAHGQHDPVSFNPRPARLAGRTRNCGSGHYFHDVSIRAPLVSRGEPLVSAADVPTYRFQSAPRSSRGANRPCRFTHGSSKRFQSAPRSSRGANQHSHCRSPNRRSFQSAPRSSRGANCCFGGDLSERQGFNPRPARLAGRTVMVFPG